MSESFSEGREHEDMLQFLYACPVGLIEIARDGAIGLMNPLAMSLLMQIARVPFITNLFDVLKDHAPELRQMVGAFTKPAGKVCANHRVSVPGGAGGEDRVMACTVVKVRPDRSIVTIADISAQVAQEQRLRQAEQDQVVARAVALQNVRFDAALSNMSQALFMFDAAGQLVVANRRVAEMFGMNPAGISPGLPFQDILRRGAGESSLSNSDIESMCDSLRRLCAENLPATYARILADGRVLAVNFVPMDGDGWLMTLEDITERRLAESKMTHMAHHDALTNLPNRTKFQERLTEAVGRSRRGQPSAVLYLDLDRFKPVNDALGHAVGDTLLKEVSRRLLNQVRPMDTVARLGGDEFAIIQSSAEHPKDCTALAARLIESISAPYEIEGHQVVIGTSVGIALLPTDGQDPTQLMKNADMAMYAAKADGRGCYRFFEPAMDALMQSRRTLELDLRKAFLQGEFEVYYQPVMSVASRSVSGFEALLRWNHPERGLVPPFEFVPLAEEIGLIVPLGKWVLRQACADAAGWGGGVKVAVNVSVIQFASRTLVDDVAAALAASGLEAERLDLEITETVMMEDTDAILTILHRLRDLGVGIVMDDFGTGYSSLSYLRRFPFNKLKIDRSFVDGLGSDTGSNAIVTAITDLFGALGMTTLAEGVETEMQLDQLRVGLCGEAQGYLFSKARPASEVASICRQLAEEAMTAPPVVGPAG